jgi:hypothetical protein
MKQQIILSALETQLAAKLQALSNYDSEIYKPALEVVRVEALNFIQDFVSPLIGDITITSDQLSFYRANSNDRSACSVYVRKDWRTNEQKISFSWYSTSVSETEVDTLTDVQIFGAVAAHLSVLKSQILEIWNPKLGAIDSDRYNLSKEVRTLECEINKLKSEIESTERAKYSDVGFELEKFLPSTSIDWSSDKPTLSQDEKVLYFQTGRGTYDRYCVTGYKVVSFEKGKYTVAIKQPNRTNTVEVVVTPKRMEDFAAEVYIWQTVAAVKTRARQEERLAKA